MFSTTSFCFIVSVKASVMCMQADMLLNIVDTCRGNKTCPKSVSFTGAFIKNYKSEKLPLFITNSKLF